MLYYYLDTERRPQGPHSQEELMKLLMSGKISAATEIAAKGSETWSPLGVIFSECAQPQQEAPAPAVREEPSAFVGHCPTCHKALTCEEDTLPPTCPHCCADLGRADAGIFTHFFRGFCRGAQLKGRDTRAAYWSFALPVGAAAYICTILSIAFYISAIFFDLPACKETFDEHIDEISVAHTSLWTLAVTGTFITVALLVPLYTAGVRRLHDTGHSAWWMSMLYLTTALLIVWFSYYLCIGISPIFLEVFQNPDICEDEAALNALIQNHIQNISPSSIWMSALPTLINWVNIFLHIFVLIFCLTDSQKGANKYGPSPKYPHAS